jgi:hypothetical protein
MWLVIWPGFSLLLMTATEKEEKIKNTFGSFTTFGGPSFN